MKTKVSTYRIFCDLPHVRSSGDPLETGFSSVYSVTSVVSLGVSLSESRRLRRRSYFGGRRMEAVDLAFDHSAASFCVRGAGLKEIGRVGLQVGERDAMRVSAPRHLCVLRQPILLNTVVHNRTGADIG